ncbi:hypothetical protein [Nocardioides silvaticus]|nr:hypothetical protein [Nocardioides silvaticus]
MSTAARTRKKEEDMKHEKFRKLAASTLVVGALGAALGVTGGAHAAGLITGQQIKDATVTTKDVRNGTVGTEDVANGSITPADITGEISGPKGPQGEQGLTGAPGLAFHSFAAAPAVDLPPGGVATFVATCDPGLIAVGGGAFTQRPGRRLWVLESAPLGPTGAERGSWVARVRNNTTITVHTQTWAICAEVK